jgi:mono/diheme cytochrome c family protein
MIRLSIAAAFASVFALVTSASMADTLVERGGYLVNTIMTCQNCHTPKGPTGDIADKAFSGGLSWDEPPFKVTAPNITQDPETGIGNWSDAEIKTLLRTGVRPNGVPIEGQRDERLLSGHHRPLHGVPHGDGTEGARLRR